MKQYESKRPVIVVGGKTGSFLGEYLAGGLIIVLGFDENGKNIEGVPSGEFIGTGMHGGLIYIRSESKPENLPVQVILEELDLANDEAVENIKGYIEKYYEYFGVDINYIWKSKFWVIKPNSKSPYKQMYTAN